MARELDRCRGTYLTTIPVEVLSAEDSALLYGARWEIEVVFKELKSHYRIDQILSANPEIVKCFILVAILTLMCSRRILRRIRHANPQNANRYKLYRYNSHIRNHFSSHFKRVYTNEYPTG